MKRSLLFVALLASCDPSGSSPNFEPLLVADAGALPDAGAPADAGAPIDAGALPDGGAPEPTGLPCDVRAVLETHCTGCHAGQTYAAHLLTRDDFLRPRLPSGKLQGVFALERMQPSSSAPMPPVGYQTQPAAADVAVIAGWVNAGMPGGTCGQAIGH